MKNNILKELSLLIAVFLCFSSCGRIKEYSGFNVNKGIIEIPIEEDGFLTMPLELYQGFENNLLEFADKYNSFYNITDDDFEKYRKVTKDFYSIKVNNILEKQLVSSIVVDEKKSKTMIKAFEKMDSSSFSDIESFAQVLSDNFDILIYIIGEAAEFDKGEAPWYESRKALFEDGAEEAETKNSIAFIEKHFPAVKFVKTYEETGAGKSGIN